MTFYISGCLRQGTAYDVEDVEYNGGMLEKKNVTFNMLRNKVKYFK